MPTHALRVLATPFSTLTLLYIEVWVDTIWQELLNGPVKDVIVFELTLVVEIAEETLEVGVVWGLFEAKVATVCHIGGHLFGIAEAESLYRGVHLAFFDLLILILFVTSAESLPWKLSFQ